MAWIINVRCVDRDNELVGSRLFNGPEDRIRALKDVFSSHHIDMYDPDDLQEDLIGAMNSEADLDYNISVYKEGAPDPYIKLLGDYSSLASTKARRATHKKDEPACTCEIIF